jgi:two-component system, chemotaxis family, CheB/CheR fusion protein
MEDSGAQQLTPLLEYLKEKRGFDFSGYKTGTLVRRINKRLQAAGVDNYGSYMDYLEVRPDEFNRLFDTILINVTGFFRDRPAWEYLEREILPRALSEKKPEEMIRVWSTGCASGQEAYSIAMLLYEMLGENQYNERVKIYATDVDEDALSQARQGAYPKEELKDVPEYLAAKYFYECGDNFCLRKDLRRNVIFGRNDLISDSPIHRLDLLICRNTLMYFNSDMQAKILRRFHFALNPKGVLFLGKAEMLLSHTHIFTPLNLKLRFFSKIPAADWRKGFRTRDERPGEMSSEFLAKERLKEAALETSPVAQILIDPGNNLVFSNEQARLLLGLSEKDYNRPFQDLRISYSPVELRSYLEQARAEDRPIVVQDIEILDSSGSTKFYDIRIQPLADSDGSSNGISLSFIDTTVHKQLKTQLEKTNHELETAMEELQSTNEELETTNEELQSTIEELETTNEELQASNEELETMNEELQSTNEELQTLNDELNLRTEDLHRLNNFLESILTSIRSAVVVMDRDMQITVWNRQSEEYWGLREEEVRGQNFLSLDIGLPVARLKNPIQACLENGESRQEVVVNAVNRRGQKMSCQVQCSPLFGKGRRVQGVIALMDELTGDGKGRN